MRNIRVFKDNRTVKSKKYDIPIIATYSNKTKKTKSNMTEKKLDGSGFILSHSKKSNAQNTYNSFRREI